MQDNPVPQEPASDTNKQYKLTVLKKQVSFSPLRAGVFVAVFAVIGGAILISSFAAPRPKTPPSTVGPLSSNIVQTWNGSQQATNTIYTDSCFGVDSQGFWHGSGTLAPGETYTFTPQYPTCGNAEIPAIVMHVDWNGTSDIKMQSKVAFSEQNNSSAVKTPQIVAKTITAPILSAPNSGKQSNFCEFTEPTSSQSSLGAPTIVYASGQTYYVPKSWSATITNTGSQTATVNFSGQETNGWEGLYYPHCYRGDSDGDHWNDALEHSLMYLNDTSSIANGSDYLDGLALQDSTSPIVSGSPADFNSDGMTDSSDVAMVQQYIGQGSGIPQDEIDPNGVVHSISYVGIWRRFDIDGDGYVTAHDVSEVQSLVGKSLPLQADYLAPWAIVQTPDKVPANYSGYLVHAFASDNDMLTHVDILAAGKLLCSTWGIPDNYGQSGQSLWSCGWNTPRQSGVTTLLTVNAYDDAGHVYSASKVVTTQ